MSNNASPVREVTLVSVPRSTYVGAKAKMGVGKQAWSATFNVACWLRVQYPIQSPIILKLLFRDSRGWRQVLVDEGFVNAQNRILLSGAAEVRAIGPIFEMKINAAGVSSVMKMSAEELFVQRVEEPQQQKKAPARAA